MTTPPPGSLAATKMVDADHDAVIAFAEQHKGSGQSHREQAVALYYAVRDGFRYNPYTLDLSIKGLRASTVLATGEGWCVTKSALLAAACRAVGIPAKLGYADVKNHLSTERLRQNMKTDVFYYHGYTAIFVDGEWRKATPAFNIELCEKFGIHPLEFDGLEDSIYHPFDKQGARHMEYLRLRGEYDDIPLQDMIDCFTEHYPAMISGLGLDAASQKVEAMTDNKSASITVTEFSLDFDSDVAAETCI